jgi:hypothetical protein
MLPASDAAFLELVDLDDADSRRDWTRDFAYSLTIVDWTTGTIHGTI